MEVLLSMNMPKKSSLGLVNLFFILFDYKFLS